MNETTSSNDSNMNPSNSTNPHSTTTNSTTTTDDTMNNINEMNLSENLENSKTSVTSKVSTSITLSRTGGIYIPPFKLQRLQYEIEPDDSIDYQRQEWERLRKRINSIVNKLTLTNVAQLVVELLECNLIRGRGLFARTWIRAQMASPGFTPIYASFLAIVNSKFPEIGELILKRIILQFRRAFKRNDRIVCQSCIKCIAHMVNQKIAHEIVALQLLAILLEKPTDDSVELAVDFVRDVGNFLHDNCKQGLDSVFDRLKSILQYGLVDKRTQYSIEALWKHWRNGFNEFPSILPELDLLEEDDQITHDIDFLDENITGDEGINIFHPVDPEIYKLENIKWNNIKIELLGDYNTDTSEDSELDTDTDVDDDDLVDRGDRGDKGNKVDKGNIEEGVEIKDMTEQEIISLRKIIYLCIMSSLNYEECVHKILKLNIKGNEMEVCIMLIDCCSMERTYQIFYSLQAELLCKLMLSYKTNFEECFNRQYKLIHRLETGKIRNISKFFAHLFYSNSIDWQIMKIIRITEEDTTSSGRIFIKILLQELVQHLGIEGLSRKFHDEDVFNHMFPSDLPKNIRFSINFLTAIGLSQLTNTLRSLL
ncbi:cell-cycle-control protein (translation regulation), putative [Theileria annulata]|uniref:Cell-cycle-control protein (Translation regulation), putative n=1 Tax=Theileria annulata TaxID=5874 RepID=Q4UJ48_THEAN|nr:cell-cycle-control protein (translation regulation), putative [Theileria annulata]CAI72891.1 cell-cycle-control protein (translation regulation), putative [Theileria annulata]|eukprot:XP_953569.1 cell-cycle-control protein (translation regulation), putative [Theileria annulata]